MYSAGQQSSSSITLVTSGIYGRLADSNGSRALSAPSVEVLQELPDGQDEDVAELEHGAQADVFLAEFERRGKRPGHARLMGKRLPAPANRRGFLVWLIAEC